MAQTCFGDWFGQNSTGAGQWQVQGQAIEPSRLTCRSLVVAPQKDRLVLPESAAALARALPNATLLAPDLGHIGMIVGRQAPEAVWQPVADWLQG